jgi:uncharacterized protein (TIGR02001 family)
MGNRMKKLIFVALASVIVASASLAASNAGWTADLPMKAIKAPAPYDPWDIAFGSAVMNDYIFRGVTQSNHNASVAAYFEPRYNVNKDLQLYVGSSVESISFANRAAAEVDVYGGIRPTFGAFAFDIGVWGYLYPGSSCADNVVAAGNIPGGFVCPVSTTTIFLADGNVMKKDVSFMEIYGKANYTVNDSWQFGVTEFYSPNFLNSGAWGDYASIVGKYTAPGTLFGKTGIGLYVSGEFGRQWLGTSDAFYGLPGTRFAAGIPYASYNTWNIGLGFTYKVFTLDLRYSGSDLSKGNCNAFTSAFNATGTSSVTAINPAGAGSNWCGAAGIAKLSADLTAMANLK